MQLQLRNLALAIPQMAGELESRRVDFARTLERQRKEQLDLIQGQLRQKVSFCTL
jgi:hypothetical protein